MIAALYARYSSDSQRAESIVAQMRASREYCRRKGYTIVKEYADEAFTGTNDARPAYRRMMQDAAAGLFEVVIFHKVDRNGRNEFDYYHNKRELAKHNVTVEYSGQAFDSTSPEGALMENQLVGLAAYYSRNLSREVKKGLKENVLAGKITGGKPPFGFSVDKEKKFIINEQEAVAIRHIFTSYAAGESLLNLVKWLNGNGYRTRKGAEFSKSSLHDILRNRRYIGTCILGKNTMRADGTRNNHGPDHEGMTIVENGCPAIVDKETFAKVQARMDENRRRGGRASAKHNYLLSGLVFCERCGGTMSGCNVTSRGTEWKYYRCSTKSNHGEGKCPNKFIRGDKLEEFILGRLSDTIMNIGTLSKLADRIREKYSVIADEHKVQREQLTVREKKLMLALDRIYTAIEEDGADDFDRARMKRIKKEILEVRGELAEIEDMAPALPSAAEIVRHIRGRVLPLIQSQKLPDLKKLLQAFVAKIAVNTEKIIVTYRFELCGVMSERTIKATIEFTREYSRELIA